MTDFYKNNDDQIRDKLSQHEFEPITGAWDSMSKLLDQQQIVPKRTLAWWWSVPLVAAALSGIIVLGFYGHKEETQDKLAAHNEPFTVIPKNKKSSTKSTEDALALTETNSSASISNHTTINPTTISSTNTTRHSKNNVTINNKNKIATKTVLTNKNKKTAATNLVQNTVKKEELIIDNNINNKLNDGININVTNLENTESNTKKVKTTRTIISYQYSTTPLRALQEKRKKLAEPTSTIPTFGIGNNIEKRKSPIKVGILAGVTSKIYASNKQLSMSPSAGLSFSYKVAPRHAIQTGLQYKSIGRAFNSNASEILSHTNTATNSTSTAYSLSRIDMLELPLVYQFYVHKNCNLQAGIKASYLFNVETNNPEFNTKKNEDLGLANFDFGMLLGVEYCFNKHWSMVLQYSLGFINLSQKGQQKQDKAFALESAAGYDTSNKKEALSCDGELIVPVSNQQHEELLRLPNQLHNNDIQLLLKYTF